jgi:polar amino acid transport system permease protein
MIREFSAGEFWFLIMAARWTLLLSLIAFAGGGLAGGVVALLRVSPLRPVRFLAAVYIKLLQGLPPLVLLFLVYFGSTLVGFSVDSWTAAVVGLTLYGSAFLGEIWRGCIEAIPAGQWDGGRAVALREFQLLRLVIVPQAVRIAIAPTVGFMVQLVKTTSITSIIGFVELTRTAQMVNNATFRPLIVFSIVAALYFVMCWPLSLLSLWLEQRMGRASR